QAGSAPATRHAQQALAGPTNARPREFEGTGGQPAQNPALGDTVVVRPGERAAAEAPGRLPHALTRTGARRARRRAATGW
ncbi:hypothetical protein, partial [Arthrobacter sp. TB 26]|uniref:hypothetical protein n=1 Tax=Arthrobacter sp. TB 26 TaxID=494420 RepID=UPI001ED9B6FB